MIAFRDKKSGVIDRLAASITRLPGMGPRSAKKAAFFLLNNRAKLVELIDSLRFASEKVKLCDCGNLDEIVPCSLCQENSDKKLLCVVRDHMDLYSIKASKAYEGGYYILGNDFSPSSPNSLEIIEKLRSRIIKLKIEEVILALSPSVEGRIMLHYISSAIKDLNIIITHLALGIPIGADFDYIDHETMSAAIVSRKKMD
jgi:recombination protein RecR